MPKRARNSKFKCSVNSVITNTTYNIDYSPFGSVQPGRSFTSNSYRFGFQGQEEDDETGWIHYKYRMHDPRLGRFFAVDPLAPEYPWIAHMHLVKIELLTV